MAVPAADDEELPPVVVLIVEERAHAADQLAQLLRLWGAIAAQPVFRLDEVATYLDQHGKSALLLLDHSPPSYICIDIALWLAARPALRQRLRVVSYTNADEGELLQRLRQRIAELKRDAALAEQLLGGPGTSEHGALNRLLDEALASEQALESVYRRLYHAHLSKRRSIYEVRVTLHAVARALVAGG